MNQRHSLHEKEEPPFLSHPNDFRTFLQSSVWADMRMFLSERLELVRDDLESAPSNEKVIALQAEARSIRVLQNLPEHLMEILLTQANEGTDGKSPS